MDLNIPFKKPQSLVSFLGNQINMGLQERSSEIVTPRYLADGTV